MICGETKHDQKQCNHNHNSEIQNKKRRKKKEEKYSFRSKIFKFISMHILVANTQNVVLLVNIFNKMPGIFRSIHARIQCFKQSTSLIFFARETRWCNLYWRFKLATKSTKKWKKNSQDKKFRAKPI